MFREFLVCAVVIVCRSPLHHVAAVVHNANLSPSHLSKTLGAHKSGRAHHQDHTALASESLYQSVVPSTGYLPTSTPSYEVNSAVVKTISQPVQGTSKSVPVKSYGSAKSNQKTAFYSAADPASPETYNIPLSYANNAVPIRPYYSSPIAAKTVTIESEGVNHQTGSPAHSHTVGPTVSYVNNVAPASPYYAAPVAAKTITVQAHGAVHPHFPAAYAAHSQNVGPAVSFTSRAVPARYSVPVATKSVAVDTRGAAHAHSPAVQFSSPIQAYGQVSAHSPALATYPVHQVQPVANPSAVRYVPVPYVQSFAAASGPAGSKTVTVTARPPIASQYASGPVLIRYAPAPIPVTNPIPVPVIYQASTVEAQQHAPQQYTVVKTIAPTAATYAQPQERVQYASVPVGYPRAVNGGAVRYNPVPVPVVHAESFIEKVYTPVGPTPTPVAPAGPYYGYARAVAFSPASAVSRVSFNGLGASYEY